MTCFDNIVGVDGSCNDVAPLSGLNLSDINLPLQTLNDIVTKDFPNGKALGTSKINFATKVIFNEVLAHFSNAIRPTSLIDQQRIGIPQENLQIQSGIANTLKGLQLEFCQTEAFLDLHVSSISIQVDVTQDVDVEVWDLIQNKLLDTITIAAVADEISTEFVNKTYKSNEKILQLAFIYDSTGINNNKTFIKSTNCSSCGRKGLSRLNTFLEARGVTIEDTKDKIRKNFVGQVDTGSVSIVYSITCNQEDWLCTFKHSLGTAILYNAGFQIATHALHLSPDERVNTSVTINSGLWEEKLAFYELKYNEHLDNVMKKIKLPRGRCYECNITSMATVTMP